MTAKLWQVVYTSRSVRALSGPEMLALERTAQARNAAQDVTGLLLFDGIEFAQAIEGPERAVQSTLHRIAADARHHRLVIAADEPILSRQFGDWAMKCHRIPIAGSAGDRLEELTRDLAGVADLTMRTLFFGFARRSQARARALAKAWGEPAAEERMSDAPFGLLVQQAQGALDLMAC